MPELPTPTPAAPMPAAEPSVDGLLAEAQAGDRVAFGRLVLAHQRMVHGLALRLLGRRDLAEDTAQEVFMQLHAKLQTITSGEHLRFWLRRVTTHRGIDELRRRPVEVMTPVDDDDECGGVDAGDPLLERQLRRLVRQLTAPARAVVVLRFQQDLDPLDIARTLDMPVNTVKSHLKRSLDFLRTALRGSIDLRAEDIPT